MAQSFEGSDSDKPQCKDPRLGSTTTQCLEEAVFVDDHLTINHNTNVSTTRSRNLAFNPQTETQCLAHTRSVSGIRSFPSKQQYHTSPTYVRLIGPHRTCHSISATVSPLPTTPCHVKAEMVKASTYHRARCLCAQKILYHCTLGELVTIHLSYEVDPFISSHFVLSSFSSLCSLLHQLVLAAPSVLSRPA